MKAKNMNAKLLFEFYQDEKVPPLVQKDQNFSNSKSKSPIQPKRSTSAHSTNAKKIILEQKNKYNEHYKINEEIYKQREQKQQLRKVIHELSEKTQKLQQINEMLLSRISEVQKQLVSERSNYDLQKRSLYHRLKNNFYEEIEEYLRDSIQKFMISLRKEKMSPLVQNKIEGFLEELININQNSVSINSKITSQQNPHFSHAEVNKTIKEISAIKNHNKSSDKKEHSPNKYKTIFQKLNRMSPKQEQVEYRGKSIQSEGSKKSRKSSPYITHPSPYHSHIRPRIFNKQYATDKKGYIKKLQWND